MEKATTPHIEGIDSQTMQGGSYIRLPDGSLKRVEGPNLTDAEKAAAPQLLERHALAMAEAAKLAEKPKDEEKPAAADPADRPAAPRGSSK